MKKFFLCFLLFFTLGFTHKVVGQQWDISDQTQSGNNVTAVLSGNTLTISGIGNMADFWNSVEWAGEAPWRNANLHLNIQTVVFQSGNIVTNIGRRAFKDCSNLQTISIPNSVTKINAQAFLNCTHSNFQSITIPTSVIEIEGEAFKNCAVKTITIAESGGSLTFKRPQISGTYYDNWFQNCQTQTLNLKRQYTFEGNNPPFKGIPVLQNLTIGVNINSFESEAFNNCFNLKNVIIEDHTVQLAFLYYANISPGHFNGCPIENLYLGRNIATASVGANFSSANPFAGNLASANATVTIGNDVTAINHDSFYNCTGLKTLTITTGSKLKSIDYNAFYGCSSLESPLTTLPEDYFETIGSGAFKGCQKLPSLTIPKSVMSIGSEAFNDCIQLRNVIIVDHTPTDKLAFTYYANSSPGHFNGCPIENLHLGRNIETASVGSNFSSANPFAGNLASANATITIGSDVTAINANSFYNCTGLQLITLLCCTQPDFGSNAFFGVGQNIPVIVPCGCFNNYKYSAWGDYFNNIVNPVECQSILTVLSSDNNLGHVTSINKQSGITLTSTWDFDGNFTPITSIPFTGKAILLANARYNSIFMGWEDEGKGNLEPMRIVDITSAKTYTALFAASETKVEESKATTSISVYPNPAKDKVIVELPENTVGTLALFDLNGKIIRRQSVNGNINTIDIAFLSAGIYILHLVQDGVASAGVKIVKE